MRQITPAVSIVLLFFISFAAGCGGGGGDSGTTSGGGAITTPGTDAGPVAASLYTYVLTRLNAIRAAEAPTAAPFVRVASLDTYAQTGTTAFMTSAIPHGHFDAVSIFPSCPAPAPPVVGTPVAGDPLAACKFPARENQGIASGAATEAAVDLILNGFLAEEPLAPCSAGRGHYDAMTDLHLNHVGIGLTVSTDGRLWMTLDFCD